MAVASSKEVGASVSGYIGSVFIRAAAEYKAGSFIPFDVTIYDTATGKLFQGAPTDVTFPEAGHGRIAVKSAAGVTGSVDLWEVANLNQGDASFVLSDGFVAGRRAVIGGHVNVAP